MYRILVTWVGKTLLILLRRSGHGGSALPGLVVEKIAPRYLTIMVRQCSKGVVLITGTNGKTSTTKILSEILSSNGQKVLVNRTGSNMSRGIVAAIVEQASWRGRVNAEYGLFEVDEAFVADVAKKANPKLLVVLNLLRDQLDRYGELDRTAKLIAQGIPFADKVVLNSDDALVKSLADETENNSVVFFGAVAKLRAQLPDDASLFKEKKRAGSNSVQTEVLLTQILPLDVGQKIQIKYKNKMYSSQLQLPGLYNAYNAVAASLSAASLGLDFSQVVKALPGISPAFGRSERIVIDDKNIELLLVKNPSGFNQVIKTFLAQNPSAPALLAINDNFADGRDVSWLWDVNFEAMKSSKRASVLASGVRGYDLAVRLKYAGISCVTETDLKKALIIFKNDLRPGETGYIVPTYTAMLKLRSLLAKEKDIGRIWH